MLIKVIDSANKNTSLKKGEVFGAYFDNDVYAAKKLIEIGLVEEIDEAKMIEVKTVKDFMEHFIIFKSGITLVVHEDVAGSWVARGLAEHTKWRKKASVENAPPLSLGGAVKEVIGAFGNLEKALRIFMDKNSC